MQYWPRILVFVQVAALVVLAIVGRSTVPIFEAIALPLLPVYPICSLAVMGIAEKRFATFFPLLVIQGMLGVGFFLAFLPLVQ